MKARAAFTISIAALALAYTTPAGAQTTRDDEARTAYDAGAASYEAKDFTRAAVLFAHADDLAPNPLVLKLALAAATQAGEPILGMTLVLRAEARAVDGSVADVARKARGSFEGRVGIVRIACLARGTCHARVGEARAGDGESLVVLPGEVDVAFEGNASRVRVVAVAGGVVRVTEPAPTPVAAAPLERSVPRALAPSPPSHGGLAPGFFWGGLVLSAALGGATIASAVDTGAKHDGYIAGPRLSDARDQGIAAQTRTNVLLGGTIAVAVVTAVVGVFFTRWQSDGSRSTQAAHAHALAAAIQL